MIKPCKRTHPRYRISLTLALSVCENLEIRVMNDPFQACQAGNLYRMTLTAENSE